MRNRCSLKLRKHQTLWTCIGALLASGATAGPLSQRQFVGNDIIGLPGDSYLSLRLPAMTFDGKSLYAVSNVEHAIIGFSRDATTGVLTVNQRIVEDIANRTGIHSGDAVVVSDDGNFVFAIGLEPGYGEPYSNGNPATTDSAVSVLQRDPATGNLSHVQTFKMGRMDPFKVTISGSGCDIFLTGVNVDSIEVLRCAANGTVGSLQHVSNPAPEEPTHHTYDSTEASALSPNQQHLYVAARIGTGEYAGAIYHFQRDPASGQLSYLDQVNYVTPGRPFSKPHALAVSPDGAFLYAASPGDSEAADIKIFAIGASGSLTLVSRYELDSANTPTKLYWPNSIDISTNGRLLYLTDNVTDALLVFGRNTTTGAIEYYGAEVAGQNGVDGGMKGPEGVQLSHDDRFAYVAAGYGIAVFNAYAALSIRNNQSVGSVAPGGEVTYSLRVSNDEGASAHRTIVTFNPPAGAVIRSMSGATPSTVCAANGGLVTCAIGTLAARAAEDITITVGTSPSGGSIISEATVSADEVDNDPSNNTAASTFSGPATPTPSPANPPPAAQGSSGGGGGGALGWVALALMSGMGLLQRRWRRGQALSRRSECRLRCG